jgi:magnesium transporter
MSEERKQLLEEIQPLLEAGDTASLKKLLDECRSSDIAEVVELVDEEQGRMIFKILETPQAAEILEKVNEATRAALFELFSEQEIQHIISELGSDDAADLLAELKEPLRYKVLTSLAKTDSLVISHLMSYSEDSAGGIMDPLVISVTENATVAEAINKVRAAEMDEDFYSVYVVDNSGVFLGYVRIRFLLTKPENTRIKDLIETDAIYMTTEMDQEEVRNLFSKNDLIVAPVLDEAHKLVGRITADRVIEVAEEEAAEDLLVMAGTDTDELEKFSALHAARIRMTWLIPCLIGTAVTAVVLSFFRTHNQNIYITASVFVPMIAAISGNAGLQTSAIVVSGLATGHLAALRLGQVFSREVRIALLVALGCGILGGIISMFFLMFTHSLENVFPLIRLMFAFGMAMFSAIMVATTLGLVLPFLFKGIGIDPAISSGPLVTTANDSISVAIYMTLAVLLAG